MKVFTAHVRGGRLQLDEPTDLPEGSEVELVSPWGADLAPSERERLLRAVEEGAQDFERGDHVDGLELIAQLRSRREAAGR